MNSERIKEGYFLLNNKKYITRAGVNLIGRNRDAAVIMKNASVSQHHALLVILDDKHYLSDLNSSNGTILDCVKLEPLRLYEIKQGASVQFADVRSTYFKATDNTEVNTQESDSSQVVNDSLFNARTQLFDGSLISAQPANKPKEISRHISDHGYTKLAEGDGSSFLNAASTSAGGGGGNNSNGTDAEVVQESRINHMNDHGYYKRVQKAADIHDAPTQVKNANNIKKISSAGAIHDAPTQVTNMRINLATPIKCNNIRSSLAEAVHDLPTQIVHDENTNKRVSLARAPTPIKHDNVESSLAEAIHDLPTQIIGGFDNDDDDDSAQARGTSIHELPTQMIHVPDTQEMLNLKEATKTSKGDGQATSSNKPSTSPAHELPPNVSEVSVLKDLQGDPPKEKSERTLVPPPVIDESIREAKCDDSNDVIDETLPDNLANADENSTDSIDFMTMQAATQHFTDHTSSEDVDTQSKLHVSQQKRKVRNVIESDDETDVESEPDLRTDKAKRTKKKNVIDSSQETEAELEEADDKAGRATRPLIGDSDSETDVDEVDVSKGDDKSALNVKDKKVSAEFESKSKHDGNTKTVKARPRIEEDSDSDTDVEIDGGSKVDGKVRGEGRPSLNDLSPHKKLNEKTDDRSTKTKKARPAIENSDSETDDEIDVSKNGKVGEDGSKKITKGRATIEDSDSETDVESDFVKDRRAPDKPVTNELTSDERANEGTPETKTNADDEIDSDSASKLIKAVKYVISSSDDSDVEEERESKKSTKETTPTNQDNKSQPVLFQPARIDESKEDENKKENFDSRLDDTDVIPATQNSFAGEIDFDFNTQDLNYAADKLEEEKARKEKTPEDTLNSEEPLGDSFKLALTNSVVEAKPEANSTIDLFLQATQKTPGAEETSSNTSRNHGNESVFLNPTQKLSVVAEGDNGDDEDEIFIQPTQQLQTENQGPSEEIFLQPQIIVGEAKSKHDGLFVKPKLASIEEKLESIFRPTQQPDDDGGIFLEATQRFPEDTEAQEAVAATFLKPAQVTHKNVKLSSKPPTQVEDNIFAQATQVLSEEGGGNAARNERKRPDDDDDIFMQATQISPEVQNVNPWADRDIFVQPTQVTSDELKEGHPPGHSVESQLEVMFASQNVRLIEDENPRPGNPLLNLLSSMKTHPEIIEINDDLPEETPNKAGPSKEKSRGKSTDSNDNDDEDVAKTNKPPKRGNRRSPLLTTKRNKMRSTRIENRIEEEPHDVSNVLSEEEQIDLKEPSKKKSGAKSTNTNDNDDGGVADTNKPPKRGSRKSPLLTTKRNKARSTKFVNQIEEEPDIPNVLSEEEKTDLEEPDVPKVLSEEEKIDLLFRTSGIMQDDIFLESAEPVGRSRRSPRPIGKKMETRKGYDSSKQTSLATVEEQSELSSKLEEEEEVSTPQESKGSCHQLEEDEEGKLQSKKRNVKSAKRAADHSGEGPGSVNIDNESNSSSKSSFVTVGEQPELPSKLEEEEVSTPQENKVSAAGRQLEEEDRGKLQSKKRNARSAKRAAGNSGEGTSSANNSNESSASSKSLRSRTSFATVKEQPDLLSNLNESNKVFASREQAEEEAKLQSKKRTAEEQGTSIIETVTKPERSRRQRAIKAEETIEPIGGRKEDKTDIHETPHRSAKRTRNNLQLSDNDDFDEPLRSDLPSTSGNRTTKESAKDAKKPTKLKDGGEVTTEEASRAPSDKGRMKSDVKEKKPRTKRTNSIANEETEEKSVKNVKRTRLDSTENETPTALGSETPSTTRGARSKRTQGSAAIEEENIKLGADVASDDEFAPAVAKKKRKTALLDSDSEDNTTQSSVKAVPATPTRRKLLQLPDNSLISTPERLKRKLKPKVVFTMLDSPELESVIRSLGGSVVDSVEASTVLVTSGVKRSQKLLSAVGLGKPICSPKWLQECRKAGSFLDPWDHILVDDEAENKWHFSLKESLQRSVGSKLLENYIVHLIVNNAQDVLKGAVESCGGKCVTRAPPKNSTANYVIVSTPENKSKYSRLLRQVPPPMVVAPEAIFDGVLRQELHFEDHRLT